MTQQNGDIQPQDGGQAAPQQDGNQNSQPGGDGASPSAPGADGGQTPTPEPRVYSEEEFRAATSGADARVAEANKLAAQSALSLHTERALAAENAATTADNTRVADGDITQDQADARARERTVLAEQTENWRKENETHEQIRSESSVLLKAMSADKIGKQFDVDPKLLLDDPELVSESLMTIKALTLANEALKTGNPAPREQEEFDGGGNFGGGGSTITEGMHGLELATLAYGDTETAKRNKNRG